MGKRIRTEDAAEVYAERHGRPWRDDAWLGLLLAASATVQEHVVRGAVAIGREGSDKRPLSRPEPLPEWCVRELKHFHAHARARALDPAAMHPVLRVVFDPRWLEIAEDLTAGAEWSEPFRAVLRLLLQQNAETLLARQGERRRRNTALYHFFVGVRLTTTAAGHGDPKASQLALMAAAAGLEPLEKGQDSATRRWENRLRRWPAEMDQANWRPLVAQLPLAAFAGGPPG